VDSWQIDRFRRPYLAIDSADYDPTANAVEVSTRGSVYTIEPTESVCDLTAVATTLNLLRDARNHLWATARDTDSGLRDLLQRMDELGLIDEWDTGCSDETVERLFGFVSQIADGVRSQLTGHEKAAMTAFASDLRKLSDGLVNELAGLTDGDSIRSPHGV